MFNSTNSKKKLVAIIKSYIVPLAKTNSVSGNVESEKPYKCHLCTFSTLRKYYLKYHLRTHTGEKPFACAKCSYCASHISNLKEHLKTVHRNYHKCELCDFNCLRQKDLNLHMQTHVSEHNNYKCQDCTYQSQSIADLKSHKKIHLGIKPHKCGHCGYIALGKYTLLLHMREHSGGKIFKCKACDFSTSRLVSLKNHMKIHTREKHKCKLHDYSLEHKSDKPFKCEECDFSTELKASLNEHLTMQVSTDGIIINLKQEIEENIITTETFVKEETNLELLIKEENEDDDSNV